MTDKPIFHIVNRFVFFDYNYGIFFEPAIDIYKNGVFFHRVPKRHKDILVKILKYGNICKEVKDGA